MSLFDGLLLISSIFAVSAIAGIVVLRWMTGPTEEERAEARERLWNR